MNAPVCDTLMGKGCIGLVTIALYTGMIGMHGTKASNLWGYNDVIFLLVLGARFQ